MFVHIVHMSDAVACIDRYAWRAIFDWDKGDPRFRGHSMISIALMNIIIIFDRDNNSFLTIWGLHRWFKIAGYIVGIYLYDANHFWC